MENDRIVFNEIPVKMDEESLKPYLQSKATQRAIKMYAQYLPIVEQIAKPKGIVKWADVEIIDDQTVNVGGQTFTSVLLADKLKDQHRVLALVVTAGNEVKETDLIENDAIKDIFLGLLLGMSAGYILNYLGENFDLGEGGLLQPGSLPDWPVINNHKLLDIIGDVEKDIGVSINDNGYMLPWNSLSGIFFLEKGGYRNCTLCTKLDCVGRGAEFNKEEYKRLFGK